MKPRSAVAAKPARGLTRSPRITTSMLASSAATTSALKNDATKRAAHWARSSRKPAARAARSPATTSGIASTASPAVFLL